MKSSTGIRATPPPAAGRPRFFASADAFRQWLERHHTTATELWIGFHRKAVGRNTLDYPTAVDVALCFGWIDGVRKRLDDISYTNRFTPRKPDSIWSTVNIARVERLKADGLMHAAGLAAFERRDPARSGVYSFEHRPQGFPAELEAIFRQQLEAWTFFGTQPPGYRRLAIWYVASAKRDDTRLRRLAQVMEVSARGERLGVLFGQKGSEKEKSEKRHVKTSGGATGVSGAEKTASGETRKAPGNGRAASRAGRLTRDRR